MTGVAAVASVAALVAMVLWPGRRAASFDRAADQGRPRRPGRGPRRGLPSWMAVARRGGAVGEGEWVAEFAELAALALDAGLPPGEATGLAADVVGPDAVGTSGKAMEEAVVAGMAGVSVGAALRRAAQTNSGRRSPAGEPLGFLGAAWLLSDDLGAPAASAARVCATVLRERAAAEANRRVVAAGPRASMWLLTALPLCGPLVGVLLGMPVTRLYGRPAAVLSVALGVVLTAIGWAWARAILRRALQPRTVG